MKHTIYALALVTSLATGIGAALAADATENDARAIATAKIGMTQAIQAAEQQVGGKASRAEFERDKKGQWVFDVEVVSAQKVMDVKVDSTSGQVIAVTEDKADHDDDHDKAD
jgi:uncharacterized membrane protein YkoI